MTREHDQNQPDEGQPEHDELQRRLDQARAELTGHVPVPEQRLDAMFVSGMAPADGSADTPTGAVPVESVTLLETVSPFDSGSAPRRRAAITAIAAAFLLLVGLVGFAAARGSSDSPVEIAGDTAGDSQQPPAADPPMRSDSGDDGAPRDQRDGSGHDGATGDSPGEGGQEHGDGDVEGQHGLHELFEGDLREQLESLWTENEAWIDCVTDAIDASIESSYDDEGGPHGPDLEELCGQPSLGGLGDGFVSPELIIPDGDLPEFDLPDLANEFCEKVETETGSSITCRWPPCPTDAGAGGPAVWPICEWPPCPTDSDDDGDTPKRWPICEWPPCPTDTDDDGDTPQRWPICEWPPCPTDTDDDGDTPQRWPICKWPPCEVTGANGLTDVCPPLDLLPPLEQFLPEDFEFDFELPFDEDDLDGKLDDLIPEQWRESLDELEKQFGSSGTDASGHGSGRMEA